LTSNKAFKNIIRKENYIDKFDIALMRKKIKENLRKQVINYRNYILINCNLNNLIKKIIKKLK
jgi:hypothetical protein